MIIHQTTWAVFFNTFIVLFRPFFFVILFGRLKKKNKNNHMTHSISRIFSDSNWIKSFIFVFILSYAQKFFHDAFSLFTYSSMIDAYLDSGCREIIFRYLYPLFRQTCQIDIELLIEHRYI